MSRLQKKCFIGATSMHLLLFVVLIVGPGFFSKDDPMDESDVITFVPLIATDENKQGGGAPQPRANPAPAPQVQQPAPPQPRVQETVRQPDPPPSRTPEQEVEREREKPAPTNNRESLDPKPEKPKPHQVQVNRRVVTIPQNRRTTATTSSNTDTTAQEQKDRERFAAQIARSGNRVREGLSSSTQVDMPEGPGGGGVSYASYGQIVRKIYTDNWSKPDDMTDDEATIKVSVTISRDGKVLSSEIIQASSSAAANRSIKITLDRITEIGKPFPEGAKESRRTFIMTFNLKAKKAFG